MLEQLRQDHVVDSVANVVVSDETPATKLESTTSELEDLSKEVARARQERDFWKDAASEARMKSDEVELELASALGCDKEQKVNDKKVFLITRNSNYF